MLQVWLHASFAEHGKYPASLSLDHLSRAGPAFPGEIANSLSAIEGYQTSGDRFSFVGVGKDGKTRCRVTERTIERN